MRPPHGLSPSSSIAILLVLALITLALPITARRTGLPPGPEQTQYLRLPVLRRGAAAAAEGAAVAAEQHNNKRDAAAGADQTNKDNHNPQHKGHYRCRPDGEGGEEERCGWHVPVVKAQAPRGLDTGVVVAAVFGAAGVFAMGLV
ncbi:hypothetical protein ACRE_072510 [Hapsidospora chrysogenum ATCC 11550]|uniref:Uncharacterized protein n=1 Tax=Hapsidospora chrysogenum (strain ATCC 11550 / CBS 779.69 / DSM 880 / IAM 14645 / JCM 23072 / IMI 49137) TaxID=857340 RepID=A0A086SY17_HAPC1|nr:hypothetical protein ACRE_072510 [Hapsidospora chrysogenum ATCC 11550]